MNRKQELAQAMYKSLCELHKMPASKHFRMFIESFVGEIDSLDDCLGVDEDIGDVIDEHLMWCASAVMEKLGFVRGLHSKYNEKLLYYNDKIRGENDISVHFGFFVGVDVEWDYVGYDMPWGPTGPRKFDLRYALHELSEILEISGREHIQNMTPDEG